MSTRQLATIAAPTIPIRSPRHWPLDPPVLRVVGAEGGDRTGPPAPSALRPSPAARGYPSIVGRLDGRPVELRVWRSRPPRCGSAIYHPAGIWVCAAVL